MRVHFSEILKNKLIYGLCTVLDVSKAPELLTQLQTIRLQCSLWELSLDERQQQMIAWQHEIYEGERKEVALALQTIRNARKELKDLQQITDASILSKARIIGCTTTKAAMCKTLLNEVGAGILLVEEAAEIREADVLTR